MRVDPDEVKRRLNTRLKMRHLMLLLQIRQHGSLTRVAEHMASSQPAVTNALAELEGMFGGPLFERSSRGMTPTALGQVVLARAQAMLHDLDHLTREIEALAAGHATRLHIGVIPFISGRTLAAAIRDTQARLPRRLTMTIHEGTSDALIAQLRDHTLDIVIGRASSTVDLDQLQFEVLHRQKPRLIASRRLAARLARHAPDWRKLVELDWILGAPHTPMREQIADLFLHAGVASPVPIVESYTSPRNWCISRAWRSCRIRSTGRCRPSRRLRASGRRARWIRCSRRRCGRCIRGRRGRRARRPAAEPARVRGTSRRACHAAFDPPGRF